MLLSSNQVQNRHNMRELNYRVFFPRKKMLHYLHKNDAKLIFDF